MKRFWRLVIATLWMLVGRDSLENRQESHEDRKEGANSYDDAIAYSFL